MSEGWSDFWAIALTARPSDAPGDARPIATFALGQSPSSPGFRKFPYSTDIAVNPQTYFDIVTTTIDERPHAVGEIWALALWEMYWNLVDRDGFDADFAQGTGGNNLALQLVMDGLELQPCNPSFLDGRDALLMADLVATTGANRCEIWRGFAKRGAGLSASDGGSAASEQIVEAFDLPLECVPEPGLLWLQTVAIAAAGLLSRRRRCIGVSWPSSMGSAKRLETPHPSSQRVRQPQPRRLSASAILLHPAIRLLVLDQSSGQSLLV